MPQLMSSLAPSRRVPTSFARLSRARVQVGPAEVEPGQVEAVQAAVGEIDAGPGAAAAISRLDLGAGQARPRSSRGERQVDMVHGMLCARASGQASIVEQRGDDRQPVTE